MKHATRLFLAALLAACASAAGAQDYPNRLVTIIVPYPAGGPTDQIARELAARLPKSSNGISWSRT
jgi:tripartite-type tricarboxylate transporter receptor subunit TctC